MNGGAGKDSILGNGGADILSGGGGADFLKGSGGADLIFGDGGADVLEGNGGRDTLDGGRGADTLTGGIGADLFVLSLGRDSVTDFNSRVDRIDASISGGFDSLTIMNLEDGAFVSFGAAWLLLLDTVADELIEDLFVFEVALAAAEQLPATRDLEPELLPVSEMGEPTEDNFVFLLEDEDHRTLYHHNENCGHEKDYEDVGHEDEYHDQHHDENAGYEKGNPHPVFDLWRMEETDFIL